MTEADGLRDTIEPKSDQLNSDDLLTGPITVRITSVKRGTEKQPVEIGISGHRPYRPCKSMRRVLIAAWGDNGREWVGRYMTLYCDPDVLFGGVAVGGIRISHLSDIEKEMSVLLATTRSIRSPCRSPFTIKPIPMYPQDRFEQNLPIWRKAIEQGKLTAEQVAEKALATGILTEKQRSRLDEKDTDDL